jgi:hypothetical protein
MVGLMCKIDIPIGQWGKCASDWSGIWAFLGPSARPLPGAVVFVLDHLVAAVPQRARHEGPASASGGDGRRAQLTVVGALKPSKQLPAKQGHSDSQGAAPEPSDSVTHIVYFINSSPQAKTEQKGKISYGDLTRGEFRASKMPTLGV